MSVPRRISKNEVKQLAHGRWDGIVRKLAPQLVPALETPGDHVDCPMHGGELDFRLFKDFTGSGGGICTCGVFPDGIELIRSANDWRFHEALMEIAEYLLDGSSSLPSRSVPASVSRQTANVSEDNAIRSRLRALWKSSLPLTHPMAMPAVRYINGRGLSVPTALPALRFHPALAYHAKGVFQGHYPGLVALVIGSDGLPTSIHRTYITDDGRKAEVECPKKLCSYPSDRPLSGAAIPLFKPGRQLAVAEGIETALAVTELTGIPCWATVTAGLK